jgi:hypothetical protein
MQLPYNARGIGTTLPGCASAFTDTTTGILQAVEVTLTPPAGITPL